MSEATGISARRAAALEGKVDVFEGDLWYKINDESLICLISKKSWDGRK